MTITDHNLFSSLGARRTDASSVYQLLRIDGIDDIVDLSYDGNVTITAGPVTVTFDRHTVTIAFVDQWSEGSDWSVVTLVPHLVTYGTIADIVAALVHHLAVTP